MDEKQERIAEFLAAGNKAIEVYQQVMDAAGAALIDSIHEAMTKLADPDPSSSPPVRDRSIGYPPDLTTRLTFLARLGNLVGQFISVEVPASKAYLARHMRENPDHTGPLYEGGEGLCVAAGKYSNGDAFVDFDYGMRWTWKAGDPVWITACSDHDSCPGPHRNAPQEME